MRAIHQFVPTYEPGAVGAHTAQVQRLARDMGYQSEIFAEFVVPKLRGEARNFGDYGKRVRAHADDVLIYQLCTGSVVADFLAEQKGRVVVNYHNVTPVSYYARWEPDLVYGLAWGRDQLRTLASKAELGIAVSSYNERELVDAGYRRTAIAPVFVDLSVLDGDIDEVLAGRLRETKQGCDWLFVGRISPNKAQHDLIAAFAVYKRVHDPGARLHLVGGSSSEAYRSALEGLTRELGLEEAVRLTGAVSPAALAAHYRASDVFVSASEHEGFCIPLLEAMHCRIPIVAYAAAAIPETLSGGRDPAGLLIYDKSPAALASAVERVCVDEELSTQLVRAGEERLSDFSLDTTRARFSEVLKTIVGAA